MNVSCLLLLLLSFKFHFGGARSTWLPIQMDDGWAAVREVEAGREFWLRPQCVLERSLPRGCASEWLVTVRFWSSPQLARVEQALRRTPRCAHRNGSRLSVCSLFPFQAGRVSLSDQQAQWSADKARFVNGPLPSTMQFRLRWRGRSNCSFEAENLVAEMSDGQSRMFISGHDVRAAYRAVNGSETKLGLEATALRIGRLLQRQKAPNAPMAIVNQLTRSLTEWARVMYPWQRNALVFRQFPSTALLSVGGGSGAVQRFSVIASPDRQPPAEREASEPPKEARWAEMEQRLSDLENIISQLSFNASNATTWQPSLPRPPQQISTSNSSRNNRNKNNSREVSVPSITDCKEGLDRASTGAANNRLFFFRPLKRLVHCTTTGELVVLQRLKGNVDFNRTWSDYRQGFGDASTGDYWLGLDFLANYTADGDVCARFQLTPWRLKLDDSVIQYSDFEVGSKSRDFRLWYTKSSSKSIQDALLEGRGQPFSTFDRDRDTFVGNCAQVYGGGNWFRSCTRANIFGKFNDRSSRSSMCWRSVHLSQWDMCSPLTSITLSIWRASQTAAGKKVFFSYIENNLPDSCKCRVQEVRINGTGRYSVLAAGAPGGPSKTKNADDSGREFIQSGGRGAEVRSVSLLRAGTRLLVAVGCAGGSGVPCGHGGDATWVMQLDPAPKLLLVAGGGGGAGRRSRGTHGRAVRSGHKANEIYSSAQLTRKQVKGKAGRAQGLGWQQLKPRFLKQQGRGYAISGVQTYTKKRDPRYRRNYRYRNRYIEKNRNVRGGGGGGGFEGGLSGRHDASGGGGGGSFCAESQDVSCEITEGGNFQKTGYVIIEKHICF